jgi:hypothetical protein
LAYEELWLQICSETGDGEAYLEFRPEPPYLKRFQRFLDPYCVTLDTNSVIDYSGEISELFQGGICQNCKSPVGPRNKRPLKLDDTPKANACMVRSSRSSITIYSYDLLRLLGLTNSPEVKLRPVELVSTSSNRYYEIIGADSIMACGVTTFEKMDITKGFQCKKCMMLQTLYIVPKLAAHIFIPKAALPSSNVFFVQASSVPSDISICVKSEMWKRIAGRRGTKGVVAGLLGVVPRSEVTRNPELEIS